MKEQELILSFTAREKSSLRIIDYILFCTSRESKIKLSRNYLKKLIRAKCVLIDGRNAGTADYVTKGQKIEIYRSAEKPVGIYELKLEVIYEDNWLAVVNKPAGLMVSGNRYKTLYNALPYNIQASKEGDALEYPQPVHRLDALTSGLIIIAKTRSARIILGEMLKKRSIYKTYQALVCGQTPAGGILDSPVNGKAARSSYIRLDQAASKHCGYVSLLELKLHTGRTHQLRIHLSEAGFPILGDKLYSSGERVYKGKGLFLCAMKLEFLHPFVDKEITLEIKPPRKFALYLQRQKKNNLISSG